MEESAHKASPKLQFAARTSAAIHIKTGPPDVTENSQFPKYPASVASEFSNRDGTLFAVITSQNVVIHNSDTGAVVQTLPQPGIARILFSPLNSYLLTWDRWTKERQASGKGNLIIWDLKTAEQLVSFIQKTIDVETWPPIRWTDDESLSARMVSTEIQFFAGREWNRAVQVLKLPGVTHFAFAPSASPALVAAFVPEKGGKPGAVRIYRYPNFEKFLSGKTFFKATSAEFDWNSTGTAVLVKTKTDEDKSNKSYYGESGIYYLSVDGTTQVQIALDKQGPIHETCWSPDGSNFVLIYGFMPAKVALFDSTCEKRADFYPPGAPRNTARWSPCGQVLLLGGFGNLTGLMDFWFVKKLRKIGSARSPYSSYCEWSPDSNYLMTAVLSPKMTVDNGIKIFKPDGTIVYEERIEKLYQAEWRPYPSSLFPAPRISLPHATETASESKSSGDNLYRHPNFSDDGPSFTSSGSHEGPQRFVKEVTKEYPEGYVPSKSAQKNKKRRDRKKKAQESGSPGATGSPAGAATAGSPSATGAATGGQQQGGAESSQAIIKQIKGIKKRLKQIKELKEKSADQLDNTQKEKIAREEALQKQLAQLQQKLNNQTKT